MTPQATSDEAAPAADAGLRLAFARGIAPSKWQGRWVEATGTPLELVPVDIAFGRPSNPLGTDMMLERALPGQQPRGSDEQPRGTAVTRHALRLYTETIALVVPADHELATNTDATSITVADLSLVTLLDHPGHAPDWPDPDPWRDPAWKPSSVAEALELVATGAGAILLPRPLARHLIDKRRHAVIALAGEPLAGTSVWASWARERDAADVQQLAGILRGRTARSSRADAGDETAGSGSRRPAPTRAQKPQAKKPALKPNSRGAQLAAAKEKAERARAAKRREKRR